MDNTKEAHTSIFENIKNSFKPKEKILKRSYILLGLLGFIIVFTVWSLLTYTGIINALFMPTPTATVNAAINLFTKLNFTNDILMTIVRVMLGFALSAIIAIPIGIFIGTYEPIQALIEPLMSFVRYLPASAFIPLFILWIGVSESEKVAVIFLGSFPQLVLMIAVAIKNVQEDLVDVAYTLGTSRYNVLWRVIFPASLPSIIDAVRIILGWAWTYVIVAELVGASSGIGYTIIQSQRMLSTANIFVGILTIGLIGLIFDYCFKLLYRILFPWN